MGTGDTFIDAPMVIKYLHGDLAGGQAGAAAEKVKAERVGLKLLTVEGADHGGW